MARALAPYLSGPLNVDGDISTARRVGHARNIPQRCAR